MQQVVHVPGHGVVKAQEFYFIFLVFWSLAIPSTMLFLRLVMGRRYLCYLSKGLVTSVVGARASPKTVASWALM
jgi:hypothetical protein